jgi:hypothetical protein
MTEIIPSTIFYENYQTNKGKFLIFLPLNILFFSTKIISQQIKKLQKKILKRYEKGGVFVKQMDNIIALLLYPKTKQ